MQKRQMKPKRKDRAANGDVRVVKDKFMEERQAQVKAKPLVPMNKKQEYYMELLLEKAVVIATGFAGTSKTYLPTALAADLYKLGKISKIVVTRPAVSSSRSLGFNPGSATEKLAVWLNSVIPVFHERLGKAGYDIALAAGDIEFHSLETIKGSSFNNTWVLVEEASDLTKEEIVKIVTRMGKSSKLVLSGDIRQSEINKGLGLSWLAEFVQRHNLNENFGFVDFNSTDEIVRSKAVKDFIICMVRDEDSTKGQR